MTPDEIRIFIEHEFKELTPAELPSGVGWSFFLGAPQRGPNSNRILRAKRLRPDGKTKLKLAVSARLSKPAESLAPDMPSFEFDFVDGANNLKKHIENELKVYRAHFWLGE